MRIRAMVTGATGMVGEGVLHEALKSPEVEAVLVLGRRSCGVVHPKLKEILHADFHDLSAIESLLVGYNACYFCLGISSIGMKEADFHRNAYELTMHVAEVLSRRNPEMVFCYVSGAGTDSTEKGKRMWARVKGKTENHLLRLPFRKVYNFRPAFIRPTPGLKNALSFYKYVNWMYPALRRLFPNYFVSLKEVGEAMIEASDAKYDKNVLEVKDIVALARQYEEKHPKAT